MSNWDPVSTIFFFDTLHGIVAFQISVTPSFDSARIFYTKDGKTWHDATLPGQVGSVNAIRYINGKLYAAASGSDVLVSIDSGATWNSAGLGLRNAWDVYQDAFGAIRVLNTSGHNSTFARIDRIHCLQDVYGGNAMLSGDGGATWSQINIGSQPGGISVYGDTCSRVFMYHDGSGYVWRSKDSGTTWQPVGPDFEPQSVWLGFNVLEGAAGTIYTNTVRGLYRTTDFGTTWTSVNNRTPNNYGHFAVFGSMGQYVVTPGWAGSENTLWLTNSGGDGTLHSSLPSSHEIDLQDTIIYSTDWAGVDTLYFSATCSGMRIPIPLEGRSDGIVTTVHIATDSLDEFQLSGDTSVILRVGDRDTTWIEYAPKYLPVTSVLKLNFHHTWRCSDWTEQRTVIISTAPDSLVATKAYVDFGSQSLCHPITIKDSFRVHAHGCEAMQVDSILFQPDSAGVTDFSFKRSGGFIPKETDTTFYLTFKPTHAGTQRGSILIYSFDGVTHRIDTIHAQGAGVADSRSFVVQAPSLAVRMCDSTAGTFSVTNTTCGFLEVDSVSLDSGFTTSALLPIPLAAGDSASVPIQFTEGAAVGAHHAGYAVHHAVLHVHYTLNGSTIVFDTVLDVAVTIAPGIPLMSLDSTPIEFGTLTTCETKSLPIVIASTGCDTLRVSSNSVELLHMPGNAFASALAVGQSDTASFTFAPTKTGEYFDTLVITSNAGGTPRATRVPLHGTVVAAPIEVALASTSLTMPQAIAGCTSDTAQIALTNKSCKSIVVDSIVVVGRTSPTDNTLAATLMGGDSIHSTTSANIQFIYTPTKSGEDARPTRVYYHGEDGVSHDTLIDVTASAIDPPQLSIGIKESQRTLQAKVFELVSLPIAWRQAPPPAAPLGVQSLSFRLTMRTDLLTPIHIAASGASNARLQLDHDTCIAIIDLPQGYSMPADSILAMIECQTYVTDTFATRILLTDLSVSAANPNCLTLAQDTTSLTFVVTPMCTDPTLSKYLTGPPFHIDRIVPNPARDEISIAWWAPTAAPMRIEICDLLGKTALSQSIDSDVRGTSVRLDALASDVYYLRLSQGGFVESRRVVIAR
jgi:hypothetical protein